MSAGGLGRGETAREGHERRDVPDDAIPRFYARRNATLLARRRHHYIPLGFPLRLGALGLARPENRFKAKVRFIYLGSYFRFLADPALWRKRTGIPTSLWLSFAEPVDILLHSIVLLSALTAYLTRHRKAPYTR